MIEYDEDIIGKRGEGIMMCEPTSSTSPNLDIETCP